MQRYDVPVVVLNEFTDTEKEIQLLKEACQALGAAGVNKCLGAGGAGGTNLAKTVEAEIEANAKQFQPLYNPRQTIEEKIQTIVQTIYGGEQAFFFLESKNKSQILQKMVGINYQFAWRRHTYSLSDDPQNEDGKKDLRLQFVN